MLRVPVPPPGVAAGAGLAHHRGRELITLLVTELVLLLVLFDLYDLVVPHAVGHAAGAVAHGRSIQGVEAGWAVDVEPSWYAALARHPLLSGAAHAYYAESIYLGPAVLAMVLLAADVERYRVMRSVFAATTLVAYLAFWLYPLAPPCLVPGSVMPCTDPLPPDPFAAMPSLHVAWAGVTAVGLGLLGSSLWPRLLGMAHVTATVVVVLATGHHFVLDAAAGLALVLAAERTVQLVLRVGDRRRRTRDRAAAASAPMIPSRLHPRRP